jgi:hypothetical protein
MKQLLLLAFLLPGPLVAQSPFDGTWIIDSSSASLPNSPEVFLLSDGVFRRAGLELKANGQDQKVPVTGYWDTMNVRVIDDYTVEIVSKKAGKAMFTETDTVSTDGNTLTQAVKDTTESEAVTLEAVYRRVAPPPAGAHRISGSWQTVKTSRSKNGSIISYKCTADGFSAETPLGEKFDAKFDGKYYLIEDDPARTTVAVKRINANTLEMTNQRDGRIVFIVRLEVTPDGKTIHASSKTVSDGSTKTWDLRKLP